MREPRDEINSCLRPHYPHPIGTFYLSFVGLVNEYVKTTMSFMSVLREHMKSNMK